MDTITIKSRKIKFGKKIIIAPVAIAAVLVVLIAMAFLKFQTYKEYQEVAVSLTLGASDKFDEEDYENNYNGLVKAMYRFYEPSYMSYTYNGVKIDNQDAISAAHDADLALGDMMSELGYSCSYGSRYLEYTGFLDWFFHYYYDNVNSISFYFTICGALFILILLVNLVYVSYKKEIVIDGDTILCNKGKKTVKQFMIKDVKSVQNKSLKGIKISGSGLRYSICLVENRDEIQKVIMDRVAELAEKTQQNLKVVSDNTSAEDIKKFKELLDAGVITQEEFDAKKKQLLGL